MYNVASAVFRRSLAIVRSLPLPGCDIYHIKKTSEQSLQWFEGNSPDKILVVFFGHIRGPALEPDSLNLEYLFNKFTSISTISPNFRTICPVDTKNSSGQNLGRKKKKKSNKKKNKKNKKNGTKTIIRPTSFGTLNKKRSKNNNSPHFVW